jgi:tetratricopeptide (TPR) repeat protein
MENVMRPIALTLLLAIAGWSLHRWTLEPLRCSLAARTRPTTTSAARKTLHALRHCTCTPHELHTRAAASEVLGDYAAAIADYQRSLTLDRRPETYFSLGMAQLETRDRASAIANLTRACAFDPARLAQIPYDDVRAEVAAALR